MKLMLTSFAVSLDRGFDMSSSPFHRMPPVFLKDVKGQFQLDFASLLLADKVVVDSATVQKLEASPHSAYLPIAESVLALRDEGFISVVDYDAALAQRSDMLKAMVQLDCEGMDRWNDVFYESFATWKVFQVQCTNLLPSEDSSQITVNPHFWVFPRLVRESRDQGPPSRPGGWSATWKGIAEYISGFASGPRADDFGYLYRIPRDKLKETICQYLKYVNSNILLSREFEAHFLDWEDFDPFYRRKFLSIGQMTSDEERKLAAASKLFELSLPELKIVHVDEFLDLVSDRRVADLRHLIERCAMEEIEFDRDFARSVFRDSLRIAKKVQRARRIACYVTQPLKLIPGLGSIMQKIVEDVAGGVVERRAKKELRWFYLLQEVVPMVPSNKHLW